MSVPRTQIQIQHLLLFNALSPALDTGNKFKYNTCYCSTSCIYSRMEQGVFKYNTCYCSTGKAFKILNLILIQIQHLLLFNSYLILPMLPVTSFKYNTCYCSTIKKCCARSLDINSNTTPVTVQLCVGIDIGIFYSFKYNTCYCSTHVNKGFLKNDKCQKPYIYAIS